MLSILLDLQFGLFLSGLPVSHVWKTLAGCVILYGKKCFSAFINFIIGKNNVISECTYNLKHGILLLLNKKGIMLDAHAETNNLIC